MYELNLEFPEAPRYRLAEAVLFYAVNGRIKAATHHEIELCRPKERPKIGPGSPLSLEAFKELADRIDAPDEFRAGTFLPECVLAFRPGKLVCYLPAGSHRLRWRTRNRAFDRFDKKPVDLPTLVFLIDSGTMQVFATRERKRPTEKSALYLIPFFNVAANGSVCLPGGAKPESVPDAAPRWIELFLESAFSHPGSSNVSFWRNFLERGARRFPLDKLTPAVCRFAGELLK